MSGSPLLTLEAAQVGYQGRPMLPALSCEIRRGEVWALVGRNGAGKSTLLRTLSGSLPLVRGRLRWQTGSRISAVPQRTDLDLGVPMRARDVVVGGADCGWSFIRPWVDGPSRRAVDEAMARTDTRGLARARFVELSEGQKQRVLMARALVSHPDVLILDEPTSAMDPANEEAIFQVLDALARERAMAILVASHHPQVVPQLADHALFVDRDDFCALAGPVGRILEHPAFLKRYGSFECFHGHWEPAREASSQEAS